MQNAIWRDAPGRQAWEGLETGMVVKGVKHIWASGFGSGSPGCACWVGRLMRSQNWPEL